MKCSPQQLSNGHWYCCRCEYTSRRPSDKPFNKECKPGLGDKVASTLSFFGITKARVQWVKRMFGSTKHCGCQERQAALNELGEKIGF